MSDGQALEVTILGCGSSAGVPRADGEWGRCDPADSRNRRSRCSIMVRRLTGKGPWTTLVVDAAPEFRLQVSAAGAGRLDALLLTHDHADQSHGLDDIRAFALRQHERIPCWMDQATAASLERRFGYVFHGEGPYPPIAQPRSIPQHGASWSVPGPSGAIPVVTFPQRHGDICSLGYRFDNIAYSSDVSELSDDALESLSGLELWIVDALREAPHPTHAHVDQALAWIERVRPRRALLTNLHFDLDYAQLAARLPPGVAPAYDGLRLEFPMTSA